MEIRNNRGKEELMTTEWISHTDRLEPLIRIYLELGVPLQAALQAAEADRMHFDFY